MVFETPTSSPSAIIPVWTTILCIITLITNLPIVPFFSSACFLKTRPACYCLLFLEEDRGMAKIGPMSSVFRNELLAPAMF